MGQTARKWSWQMAGLPILLLFPVLFSRRPLFIDIGVFVGIYFVVCVGLSLIFGFAGQLSIATAAYYGIGAYTSAILTTKLGLPVLLGFLCAALLAGVIGWLVAAPLLRLRHFYLAMATLAFGEIMLTVFEQEVELTGGSTGIVNLPAPAIGTWSLDTPTRYYYLVWLVALVAAWICNNILSSRIGRGLRAISASEAGAVSCGTDVTQYKTWMFTLGAIFAGLAGALFVHYMTFISPDGFTKDYSVLIVMMLAVGGLESLAGSLLGALFMVVLPMFLAGYDQYSRLIYGGTFLLVVMFMPRGFAGAFSDLLALLKRAGVRWIARGEG